MNHRQFARLAHERHAISDIAAPQRHGEEKPQRRHRCVQAGCRGAAGGQMQVKILKGAKLSDLPVREAESSAEKCLG
jgi:hypothetical protein